MNTKSWPTWSTLRNLGASTAIRSANIWAVIVPMAARFLHSVQEKITVEILGHTFSFHLSLPFSWKVLFIAAIAFLFANIVYMLFCPKLIKETENFGDFAKQKRSGGEIKALLENNVSVDDARKLQREQWMNWISTRHVNYRTERPTSNMSHPEMPDAIEDRGYAEAYALAVNCIESTNASARVAATILYGIGLCSLLIVVGQNIVSVAENW